MPTARSKAVPSWGDPPWRVHFPVRPVRLPEEVDVAIVGGGFTGLAAACALREQAPNWSVALFEAATLGSGASGRTGGIILNETAFGPLPDLGDVLGGFARTLEAWKIDCGLESRVCWEISRQPTGRASPIRWEDYGTLRVENQVPGGTVDPGKLIEGLARRAVNADAALYEDHAVREVKFGEPLELVLDRGRVRARRAVFATEAYAHRFAGLASHAQSFFTLTLATAPLGDAELNMLGLGGQNPFYTLDFPYLWGRVFGNNQVIFGGGLVEAATPEELEAVNIEGGHAARSLAQLEERVRGLHRVLRDVAISHRWGGPISFPLKRRPIFMNHPDSQNVLVLGGYAGQGVALSVYLSRWVAEALLERREPPVWGKP